MPARRLWPATPHRPDPFWPGRHVLHLAGIDQPTLKSLGLQQVIHTLPIAAGGLHHHPLHMPLAQPGHHLQQLRGAGAVAAQFLHPPAWPVGMRTRTHASRTAWPRSSAAIRSTTSSASSTSSIFDILPAQPITTRRSPAGTERDGKSRTLVLVATMRSPTTGSPDHTYLRNRCAKLGRPRRATAPRSSRLRGRPKGIKELIWVHGRCPAT